MLSLEEPQTKRVPGPPRLLASAAAAGFHFLSFGAMSRLGAQEAFLSAMLAISSLLVPVSVGAKEADTIVRCPSPEPFCCTPNFSSVAPTRIAGRAVWNALLWLHNQDSGADLLGGQQARRRLGSRIAAAVDTACRSWPSSPAVQLLRERKPRAQPVCARTTSLPARAGMVWPDTILPADSAAAHLFRCPSKYLHLRATHFRSTQADIANTTHDEVLL